MKIIRDTHGDVALGLCAHKTTKHVLPTFQHLGGKSTELPNKKWGTIKESILKRYYKTILEELTKFALALTTTNIGRIPVIRVEGRPNTPVDFGVSELTPLLTSSTT